jgi:pilus assembly protein CpaC
VTAPQEAIVVVKGQTALIVQPVPVQRLSIADPTVAEVLAVSPQEILVNGKELGSTSLLIWDQRGQRHLYTVEVLPDTVSLRQTIRQVFPGEEVVISTSGRSVILSGPVSTATVGERLQEIAEAAGFTVISNLQAPPAPQILLEVRFAEVSRSALEQFGAEIRALRLGGGAEGPTDVGVETAAGLLRLSLLDPELEIDAVIRALRERGLFRSLAEPNLLARNNEEASFLAGGEFPVPVAQGGAANAVSVEWKEFGVRLRFRPTILANGVIRLAIAPEVSSLDFANSIRLSGFVIPSLLTRRAETEVELREGQYLAIAGLLDNSLEESISKLPILGDIPILGQLFRLREERQARTELLVLVSPRLVAPSNVPIPVPTGEPETWRWDPALRDPPPIRRK